MVRKFWMLITIAVIVGTGCTAHSSILSIPAHFSSIGTAMNAAVAGDTGAATELDLASIDRVVAIVEPEVTPQTLTFTDVFADSGFSNWTYVNQANVIDFNGDGWDDLFFARRDGMTPRLFVNDRAGRFEEDNEALGALEGLMVEMVDFGDVDNDGALDILARMADNTLRIFMRDGTDYTDQTPVSIQAARFGDVGLMDSDNDGDLDIVGKSGSSYSPGELQLFVNNMMVFSPIVIASSITWVAVADLDGDGLADLVTTDGSSHRVFRNTGSNLFAELTNAGLAPNVHYEACFFDYDNDGDLDIYGGNPDWPNRRPRLSRNDGNMVFFDATQESMSAGQHYYAAAIAADPDRDGDLDYYNTMGTYTNGLFFENLGGVFAERSGQYGINVGGLGTTKSGVWIDFDKDHDLDLLVVNTWNADGGWLFRNDVEAGNWLEVQPIATQSNSSFRGVKVTAYWGGASQIQHYEFNASYYPASRSRTKHFGLGSASVVDSVVVRWPSGVVSVKRNVPANRVIQVQETARPEFVAIEDVPGDQGGSLSLTFSAVVEGASDGGGLFTRYEVQRWDGGGWITAVTIPAEGVDPYQVIVETPDILTIGLPPRFTKFRVAATMMGDMTMSLSAVDSAYSIDNLPPPKPTATMQDGPGFRVIVSDDPGIPDLAQVRIFRGSTWGFEPTEPIHTSTDLSFLETQRNAYYYRVQFADTHGNLSEFSDVLPRPTSSAQVWEDFGDNVANGFEQASGNWEIIDGKYHCFNSQPGVKHVATVGEATWSDYRFECDILATGAPEQEFLFRYQSPDDWYVFGVLSSPYDCAVLWKCVGGVERQLAQVNNIPNAPGMWRHLAVEVQGAVIRAYFDGVQILSYVDSDAPLLTGKVALDAFADAAIGWQEVYIDNVSVLAMGTPSGVPDAPLLDSQMQVYPNPFNPQTKIAFRLESAGEVSLAIFDVQGRLVRRLISGSLAASDYSVEWNGKDSAGRAVSAGTYLCRLSTAGGVQTRKLSLVR